MESTFNPDTIFQFVNKLAMMSWLLLILLPRWKWTARFVTSLAIPVLLGVLYVHLVATYLWTADGGFGSLRQVSQLFQNPHVMLAGWIHYLAFDLFIGSWQVRDAQRLGIHHLLVVPALALTFAFGPAGLLVYFVIRLSIKRKLLVGSV